MPIRRAIRAERAKRTRWAKIKAIRLPEPTVVKQADVTVLLPSKQRLGRLLGRGRGEQELMLPVVANRRYRRQVQGRVAEFDKGRPKAARLTPVQPDGRAAAIMRNRLQRRAAQELCDARRLEIDLRDALRQGDALVAGFRGGSVTS